MNGISLTVPSSLRLLSLIRSTVRNFLEIENIKEKFIFQLLSVVDELSTNAIEHGYKYSLEKDLLVKVRVNIEENQIELEVEDFGEGIQENSNSKEEGGMGLHIVRGMVDKFEIIKKEKGLAIKVYKKIEEGN